MKFKKFWINSSPTTDSEIVTQFKLAIDTVANGEKPWELENLRDAISSDALDHGEQGRLKAYLDAKKKAIATDILNAELTKVLVGAQDAIGDIGTKTRSLGMIKKAGVTTTRHLSGDFATGSAFSSTMAGMQNSANYAKCQQTKNMNAQNMNAEWHRARAQQMRNVGYDSDTDSYILK